MSYDLYFTEPKIAFWQFEDYFSGRDNYNIENTQAWYANEDTGVYFSFEYTDEPSEDPEAPSYNVSFNLNYYRPHFFALEAEPEIQNFVNQFGFKIHDPQAEGMGEGPYSTDGFLRGWNHGNEFGYSSIMTQATPDVIHARPKEELEAIWTWNYSRKQTQNKFGENVFVPRIMYMKIDDKILSFAIWPDAIPTLIPQVDALVIPRQELAPRRFFRKKGDMCIIPFDSALPILKSFRSDGYSMSAYLLSYATAPANVSAFVKGLKPNVKKIDGVAMDQVLNQELIEKVQEKLTVH